VKQMILALSALTALGLGVTVHAGPPPHAGPPAHAGADRGRGSPDHFQISERERRNIQNWYQRNLPPGLAKQGKIPPGHAKRLARGSTWPPSGIAYEPLPRELVRQLQPLPERYGYYRVGADVVIADLAGQVVADIVYDLLQ